jgi:predicted DNA-binding transcriptional regulator YafY
MARPENPLALNLATVLHRLMVDPRGWRVDRLMEELGIQPRTYRKYRGLLRDHLEQRIDPTGGWRVVEVQEGEARYLRLQVERDGAEEKQGFLGRLAGFWLARKLFEFSGEGELRDAAEGAWTEFIAGIRDKPFYLGHLLRNTDRMIHYQPHAPKDYTGHEETLSTLIRALFFSRKVEFEYYSASQGTNTKRSVCPLTLVMWRSALYLVASEEEDGDPKVYAIERITELSMLEDRFRYPGPRKYDPEEFFKGSMGIFQSHGGEDQRVVIQFSNQPWLYRYLTERTWHESQQFTRQEDGSVRMEMTLQTTVELVPWVRSFGEDARVIEPAELQEQI